MNKKANIIDIPFLIVIGSVLLALTSILAGGVLYHVVDAYEESPIINADNMTTNNIVPLKNNFYRWADWIFVFAFIVLWIFIFLGCYFIPGEPIFMVFGTLLWIISIILAAVFANYFVEATDAASDTILSLVSPAIENQIPMTIFVMTKLPFFVTVFGMVAVIILYSKFGRGSQ